MTPYRGFTFCRLHPRTRPLVTRRYTSCPKCLRARVKRALVLRWMPSGEQVLTFEPWEEFASRRGYSADVPIEETELQTVYRLAVTTKPAKSTGVRHYE